MRGMIPKAGTPMWRLLHLSEQKAARETKAVMWQREGTGCHRSGSELMHSVWYLTKYSMSEKECPDFRLHDIDDIRGGKH